MDSLEPEPDSPPRARLALIHSRDLAILPLLLVLGLTSVFAADAHPETIRKGGQTDGDVDNPAIPVLVADVELVGRSQAIYSNLSDIKYYLVIWLWSKRPDGGEIQISVLGDDERPKASTIRFGSVVIISLTVPPGHKIILESAKAGISYSISVPSAKPITNSSMFSS